MEDSYFTWDSRAAGGLTLLSTTATASPTLVTMSLVAMSRSMSRVSCLVVTVSPSLAGIKPNFVPKQVP